MACASKFFVWYDVIAASFLIVCRFAFLLILLLNRGKEEEDGRKDTLQSSAMGLMDP